MILCNALHTLLVFYTCAQVYGTILDASHLVEPSNSTKRFVKSEYYQNPQDFRPVFHEKIAPVSFCFCVWDVIHRYCNTGYRWVTVYWNPCCVKRCCCETYKTNADFDQDIQELSLWSQSTTRIHRTFDLSSTRRLRQWVFVLCTTCRAPCTYILLIVHFPSTILFWSCFPHLLYWYGTILSVHLWKQTVNVRIFLCEGAVTRYNRFGCPRFREFDICVSRASRRHSD